MAADNLLEALKAKQSEQGLSLRALAKELGISHVLLSWLFQGKRTLTKDVRKAIERFLRAKPSPTLAATLGSFVQKNTHRSARTRENVQERLLPFVDYLARNGVHDPLNITREHIDSFLAEIAKGRRGRQLSPSSVYTFAKDVKAFVNHIADTLAPDDWLNPVRKFRCDQPRITIHPMSTGQVDALLSVAESYSPTVFLKARNKAMLYILLDGALRIGELLSATRYQLAEDGTLRVNGKGQKEREVALSSNTLRTFGEYMRLRQDNSPYLIVTEAGRPLTYRGVLSLFQRWRKAVPGPFQGIRLSAHTLRHTSATMRRIAGMSEGDLQTFLGHSSPVMTRHYSAFALSRTANQAALRTSPVERLI